HPALPSHDTRELATQESRKPGSWLCRDGLRGGRRLLVQTVDFFGSVAIVCAFCRNASHLLGGAGGLAEGHELDDHLRIEVGSGSACDQPPEPQHGKAVGHREYVVEVV